MAGDCEKYGLAVSLREWFERDPERVRNDIQRYFFGIPGEGPFDGRHFESFIAMGDPACFGPVDLLAIQALQVSIPSGSALRLLGCAAEFNAALNDLPSGQLWETERAVFEPGGAVIKLFKLLDELPHVGTTKATKLMAAKRPHLIPIQDAFVQEALVLPKGRFWLPMYDQLADASLRKFIGDATKGAPDGVSLLRRIDVAVWMHVNDRKKAERVPG
jgi:hypothetical protein